MVPEDSVAAEDVLLAGDTAADAPPLPADTVDIIPADSPCIPSCEGMECGSDGCGGICGECDRGCNCGDGICWGCWSPEDWFEVSDTALKVNQLQISGASQAGHALDIDEDPDTCAPIGDCIDGLDNGFAATADLVPTLFELLNSLLASSLQEGTLVILMDPLDTVTEGEEFLLQFYSGAPVAGRNTCDWQTEACEYLVDPASYNYDTHSPGVNAEGLLAEGHLIAGGAGALFLFNVDVVEGLVIPFLFLEVHIEADATLDGNKISSLENGVLGAAVEKAWLMDFCHDPEGVILELVNPLEGMCSILEDQLQPDIDWDGDGTAESVSFALEFSAIPAMMVGLLPE